MNNHLASLRAFSPIAWSLPVALLLFQASALFDLSDGRFALFMDEQISFDGVKAIYGSSNAMELARNLVFGYDGDLRYGRAFWNVLALVGLPAFIFAGDSGLIIMNRLTGLTMQFVSYFFFARALALNSWVTPLFVAFLSTLPTHLHFSAMPKPEPLMMLAISLALWVFSRNNFQPTRLFGLFLGFAFGVKVSALPIVGGLVIAAGLLWLARRQPMGPAIRKLADVVVWFALGWVLCSPILLAGLWPLLVLRAIPSTLSKTSRFGFELGSRFSGSSSRILLAVGAVSALTLLVVVTSTQLDLRLLDPVWVLNHWWKWNSSEARLGGVSLASISGWNRETVSTIFAGSNWLATLTIVSTALNLTRFIHVGRFAPGLSIQRKSRSVLLGLIVIGLALLSWASIVLTVERNWGFYLHPTALLFWVGIAGLVLHRKVADSDRPRKPMVLVKTAAESTLPIISGLVFMVNIASLVSWHDSTSSRTSSDAYQTKLADYQLISSFLQEEHQTTGRFLQITMDPFLFQPDSTLNWNVERYWGNNIPWETNPDVIALDFSQLSIAEQSGHIATGPSLSLCEATPCYTLRERLGSGGAILTPRTTSPTHHSH